MKRLVTSYFALSFLVFSAATVEAGSKCAIAVAGRSGSNVLYACRPNMGGPPPCTGSAITYIWANSNPTLPEACPNCTLNSLPIPSRQLLFKRFAFADSIDSLSHDLEISPTFETPSVDQSIRLGSVSPGGTVRLASCETPKESGDTETELEVGRSYLEERIPSGRQFLHSIPDTHPGKSSTGGSVIYPTRGFRNSATLETVVVIESLATQVRVVEAVFSPADALYKQLKSDGSDLAAIALCVGLECEPSLPGDRVIELEPSSYSESDRCGTLNFPCRDGKVKEVTFFLVRDAKAKTESTAEVEIRKHYLLAATK